MLKYYVIAVSALVLVIADGNAEADEIETKVDLCISPTVDAKEKADACTWLLNLDSGPDDAKAILHFSRGVAYEHQGLAD